MNRFMQKHYGYCIVGATFVFMIIAFGVNYNFGVFFDYIQQDFGWGRGTISAAYSLMTVVSGFAGIIAGRISDKKGPFVAALILAVCLGVGYMLLAGMRSLGSFYLIHATLLAIGIGWGWPALLPQIGHYFHKNRGLMMGIASSGIGASTFIIAPVTNNIIGAYGWRATFVILGLAFLLILGAVSFVFKDAPKYRKNFDTAASMLQKQGLSFKEAIKTTNFYLFCAVFFLFGYNLHSIMIHIVPYGLDLGYGDSAIGILVFIGIISMLTRIAAAWLTDKIGVKKTLLLELSLMLAAFVVILLPAGPRSLYVFGGLFGLAYGGGMAVVAIAVGDYFGKGAGGTILGGITALYTVGGALGPLATGFIFDFRGNYTLAFMICLVFAAVCLGLCSKLSPPQFEV